MFKFSTGTMCMWDYSCEKLFTGVNFIHIEASYYS